MTLVGWLPQCFSGIIYELALNLHLRARLPRLIFFRLLLSRFLLKHCNMTMAWNNPVINFALHDSSLFLI